MSEVSRPMIGSVGHIGGDLVFGDKIVQASPIGVAALHQLPPPPAAFTGHAAELAELLAALRQPGAALCRLGGMGGVGKTALALVLAHALAADYPDAQIFLNLQGVTQPLKPEAVMAHVIRAYQPVARLPDDSAQLAAAYRSVLAGQRALLLFDNAAGAYQIKPLLPPAGCLLITTARQKFALPGMVARTLPSLPPAEARALLLALAPRMGAQAGPLARLCGYLPLALTLAGGALAERDDLEPAEYAARLERARLSVLDEVAASLGLSYDLLEGEARAAWRGLAVFPDDFDRAAAAAVWALEEDPAGEHLSHLLRYSLLEFNPDTRRYHLHDLARDFARSRLSAVELAAAQHSHAEHYWRVLAAANRDFVAGGDSARTGLARFDLERANILAGQAWAASHAAQDEAAAWLANRYPAFGLHALRLRLPPREMIAWLEAGRSAAQHLGQPEWEVAHLGNLAIALGEMGEPRQAIRMLEQALSLYRELGQPAPAAVVFSNLGNAYLELGETQAAIWHLEQALGAHRAQGNQPAEAGTLGSLGIASRLQNEPQRALAYYCRARRLHRRLGDRVGEATVLNNLGNVYGELGKTRLALVVLERALALSKALGDLDGLASARWNLGLVHRQRGDPATALSLMEMSLAYEQSIGHPRAVEHAAYAAALRQRIESAST